jgi:hypothetical protein
MELNGIRISTVRELIQMRATQVFIVRIRTIIFERNTFIGAGATQYLLLLTSDNGGSISFCLLIALMIHILRMRVFYLLMFR